MTYLIDPRDGDAEDDASSTKKRPMLAIAGSMLAELSPAKFLLTWIIIVAGPALTIGMIPPIASAWLTKVSDKTLAFSGLGSALIIALLAAIGWFGLRPLVRFTEANFWSLNSIAVQPCYALAREGLRHISEHFLFAHATEARRALGRGRMSIVAGALCALAAGVIVFAAWPHTQWGANFGDLGHPMRWVWPAIANAAVILAIYFGIASIVWGASDAWMDQPARLGSFSADREDAPAFRVVHLSDLHIVGEPFGFRIESGRAGPQGNARFELLLDELNSMDQRARLDLILITGDMTDSGRSAEWAAFLDTLEKHPSLLSRTLILPGNHDVNIVDRANPARLEMPLSPQKRLRQLRLLSAMEHVQGDRVHVFDRKRRRVGATLSEALAPSRAAIGALADKLSFSRAYKLAHLWADCFPLVMPPADDHGVGVMLLNSNADTNFSFTNALGLVTVEDVRIVSEILRQTPQTRWIIGLHHHLVEYPMLAKSFSERIGTSLINGSWFVRQLKPFAGRVVLMHGHRHIDWIGHCGELKIISAPSPLMEALNQEPTSFLIHSLTRTGDGNVELRQPLRVNLPGVKAAGERTPCGALVSKVSS